MWIIKCNCFKLNYINLRYSNCNIFQIFVSSNMHIRCERVKYSGLHEEFVSQTESQTNEVVYISRITFTVLTSLLLIICLLFPDKQSNLRPSRGLNTLHSPHVSACSLRQASCPEASQRTLHQTTARRSDSCC